MALRGCLSSGGGIHGLYSLYERATEKYRNRLWKALKLDGTKLQWFIQWSITMGVVLFSWVFFRAESLEDANLVFQRFFDIFSKIEVEYIYQSIRLTRIGFPNILIVTISMIILESFQLSQENLYVRNICYILFSKKCFRYFVYNLIIIWILIFGYTEASEFIYFEF